MKPYLTRVTRYTIAPQGESSFSEQAIQVELVDEAAGEHIRITTQLDTLALNQEVPIDIEVATRSCCCQKAHQGIKKKRSMKQDTKETIGSRGTVAGFRPLIGEERWHRGDFTAEMLEGGYRPLLFGEEQRLGDKYYIGMWKECESYGQSSRESYAHRRTHRPLQPPQVETFEAHGHVWYRHTPGDKCPVEPDVAVDCILACELDSCGYMPLNEVADELCWSADDTLVGYRFPDFPAVHTTLQQLQPSVQHVEKTEQSFQHDTTKQRLLTMYHGWCDVAPDSVTECIADVAKVLYPTDADRCEAEFQKWWNAGSGYFSERVIARAAWDAAWNAAKQRRQ